jgi:hypothetical protein
VSSVFIHNQCSDFELVSPVYFGHNAIWVKSPDQKVDANMVTVASLGRDVVENEFSSALIYKLQRKNIESNDTSNMDNTKDTSTNIQLLIMWGSDIRCEIYLHVLLIKHSNEITWDEDKLKKLHSMHHNLLKKGWVVRHTWLLDGVTVLKTMLRWKYKGYMIEVIISEWTREEDSKEPLWVPSDI